MDKLEEILRRVEAKDLQADDYETIRTVIESYVGLYFAVGDKNTTIQRLRKMLFGARTEKTSAVIGGRKRHRRCRRCRMRPLRRRRLRKARRNRVGRCRWTVKTR